jgi:hypothetical protein
MIMIVLFCLLVGGLLGMRFKVAILLPAMLVIAALILTFGIYRGQEAWSVALSQVLALISLQFGYLAAMGLSFVAHPFHMTVRRHSDAVRGSGF